MNHESNSFGKRRLRWLTREITGPGRPEANQEAFDQALQDRCGCCLAWHRRRRVFVVCRVAGAHVRNFTELGHNLWPLRNGLVHIVAGIVAWAESQMDQNPDKMADAHNRLSAEIENKKTRELFDERFPDFWKDFTRKIEIIENHGRRPTRFMDLGSLSQRLRA